MEIAQDRDCLKINHTITHQPITSSDYHFQTDTMITIHHFAFRLDTIELNLMWLEQTSQLNQQ